MAFAPIFQRPFSATFDRRAAVAAGNGLLNALIAYWPGNEASGNLLDAHTNGLDLTDTNTVTNAVGKVYATARQYTAVNSERHERPGDDAILSMGDVEMTLAAWVYLDSKGANREIATKYNDGTTREYRLEFDNGSDRYRFVYRDMANLNTGVVLASTFGSPGLATWHLVVVYHDPTANTTNIQINNGAVDSAAWSGGILDGTEPFRVGSYNVVGSPWDGRIGPVAMWKSAAGGGGVLTAAQRTALYNAGNGLAYSAFTT